MDFRIAFLCDFLKDEGQIQRRHGDIQNIQRMLLFFKVRISLVWHQFELEQGKVTGQRLAVACLVNILDSLTGS